MSQTVSKVYSYLILLLNINFQGAGYKPSPLGGNVFSKYFPWPNIGDIMGVGSNFGHFAS